MKTFKLKLGEILQLEVELNGVSNQETGEIIRTGLLSEKLKFKTKYWLTELSKFALSEKESITKLRDELVRKYGTNGEDGNIVLNKFINQVTDATGRVISGDINPNYTIFESEFNEVLGIEKDVETSEFTLEEFDFETTNIYPVFFKLCQ